MRDQQRSGTLGPDHVFIIAEAGVNHNGSIERALDLVNIAADAGADAVKFQTFRASALATKAAPKAAYQAEATGGDEGQLEMLQRLELGLDAHRQLLVACERRGIEFMSTAFDHDSLDFLVRDIKVRRLKSPSGELTNAPYLLRMAHTGLPILLSTGMARAPEIGDALAILAFGYMSREEPTGTDDIRRAYQSSEGQALLREHVTILHCTSTYPTLAVNANLRAMNEIGRTFGLPIGYSDHTQGTHITMAAVALGAKVIEKHLTVDRSLPGPDHKASLEPAEFMTLVKGIREVSVSLGDGFKRPVDDEYVTIAVARRSIVAACAIKEGESLSGKLAAKRPSSGISPMHWWTLQKCVANRDYAEDEIIDPSVLGAGQDCNSSKAK